MASIRQLKFLAHVLRHKAVRASQKLGMPPAKQLRYAYLGGAAAAGAGTYIAAHRKLNPVGKPTVTVRAPIIPHLVEAEETFAVGGKRKRRR